MDLSADHGAIRARASALVLAHESVPLLVRTPLPVLIDCRSGTTVVTLLNCIYKGPCPPLYVYRLRFRPCSGTTSRFSSGRIASRSCSCLLPSLPCHFNFFIIRFSVWVSPTPTPGQKYPSTSPSIAQSLGDRGWIVEHVEDHLGRPSWTLMYLMPSLSTS